MDPLEAIVDEARRAFDAAADAAALENAKARFLGKAGALTAHLKSLAALAADAARPSTRPRPRSSPRSPHGARRSTMRASRASWPPTRSTSPCPAAAPTAAACIR